MKRLECFSGTTIKALKQYVQAWFVTDADEMFLSAENKNNLDAVVWRPTKRKL